MTEPVVLAFSGGLDTSYCVLALKEQGFEVHTVFVDTGGIPQEEIDWIAERAHSLGAAQHHLVDVSQAIWDEFVTPLVWSHARMLGEYPLLCSDRYLIVRRGRAQGRSVHRRGRRSDRHGRLGCDLSALRGRATSPFRIPNRFDSQGAPAAGRPDPRP